MIFLIFTPRGLEELLSQPAHAEAVWVSQDVVDEERLVELRATGLSITAFSREITPSDGSVDASAIDIIQQHHPGKVVWVEH